MSIFKVKRILSNSFYPAYMLVYFLLMFGISITSYVGFPIVVGIVFCGLKLFIDTCHNHPINIGKRLFITWFILNLSSIIMYVFNEMPINCYAYALQYYLFPMLFFFICSD